MKPEIKTGLRSEWQKHLLKKWIRKYFFMQMKNTNIEIDDCITEKYGTINEIQYIIDNKQPFVARHNRANQLYIKTKQGKLYKFSSNQVEAIQIFECIFHSLHWEEQADLENEDEDPECMFLPLMESFLHIENVINCSARYYIITNRWREFDQTFTPIMPRAKNKSVYNEQNV